MNKEFIAQSEEALKPASVETFDLHKLVKDKYVLEQVIDLYISAFREPPWNEDFHNPYSVLLEIAEELSTPGASMFARRESIEGSKEPSVVAFGWGYPSASIEDLVKAKYTGEMVSIAQAALEQEIPPNVPFWYTSEVVTDPKFTRRGFATELVLQQEQHAKNMGLGFVVLRTTSDSPMNHIAGTKANMKQIIGSKQKYKDVTPNYGQRALYIKSVQPRADLINSNNVSIKRRCAL